MQEINDNFALNLRGKYVYSDMRLKWQSHNVCRILFEQSIPIIHLIDEPGQCLILKHFVVKSGEKEYVQVCWSIKLRCVFFFNEMQVWTFTYFAIITKQACVCCFSISEKNINVILFCHFKLFILKTYTTEEHSFYFLFYQSIFLVSKKYLLFTLQNKIRNFKIANVLNGL